MEEGIWWPAGSHLKTKGSNEGTVSLLDDRYKDNVQIR